MQAITPQVRLMTYQEADYAGLHNRGLMLEYENRSYRLNAGSDDTVHVFTRSIYIFVLTISRPLGYLGLDAYAPLEEEPINTIFLHSESHITDLLGRHWKQMTPETIAIRLLEYIM